MVKINSITPNSIKNEKHADTDDLSFISMLIKG